MAVLIASLAVGWGAAPPAQAAGLHTVHPGESIQEAVDHARPGDTVLVMPGVYRESVDIRVPGVTLRGAWLGTVIAPGSARSGSACAKAGHGICVTGSARQAVSGVRIRSLTVAGFKKSGIWGSWTDRMSVRGVLARDNGEDGIGQQMSTRGDFRNNAAWNNGRAGIFLANTVTREAGAIDTRGAVIDHNVLRKNHFGVIIRRARNLVIKRNLVSDNCGGVFIVGDENVPRAGDLTIRGNEVSENNRYCSAAGHAPRVQGAGIVLTGAEQTLVTGNLVRGNVGHSALSGGIVLFRSHKGAPNSRITIRRNTALENVPADLADLDTGRNNTFAKNDCHVSVPTGRC